MRTVIKYVIIISVMVAVLGISLTVSATNVENYMTVGYDIIGKELVFKYSMNNFNERYDVFRRLRAFIDDNKDEYGTITYKCTVSLPGYPMLQGYTIRIKETEISQYIYRIQVGFLTTTDNGSGTLIHTGYNFIDLTFDYDEREFTERAIDGNLNRMMIQGYNTAEDFKLVDFVNMFYAYDASYTVDNDNQIIEEIESNNFLNNLSEQLNNIGLINTSVASLIFKAALYITMCDYVKDIIYLFSIVGIVGLMFKLMARIGDIAGSKKE